MPTKLWSERMRRIFFNCMLGARRILRWILKKYGHRYQLDANGLRYGPVTCFCEHIDEPSGFINTEENRDWLSSCHFSRTTLLFVVT